MDTAEWIIAGILSLTLFVFLILGIILLTKLLDLSRDAKHIMKQLERMTKKGNNIVSKASETVDDLASTASSAAKSVKKDVTSTSGVVRDAVVSVVSKKFGLDDEEEKVSEKSTN
ncbi:hypothetical protein IJ380_03615 [Candidatus Saccharibacteria bacterium]|nr:hypothetical protein [Candidatus Saccharibacteria bacterium]